MARARPTETRHDQTFAASTTDDCERRFLADRRSPALGTARSKPAGQDIGLNVNNVASIDQPGDENTATTRQYGNNGESLITQSGAAGTPEVNNVVRVTQDSGSNNEFSSVIQDGSDNTADVYQDGTNNESWVMQTGSNHVADVKQYSSDNDSTVTQSGSGNTATVTQGTPGS